ncbi:MAG: diguanylate cyclase [Bacillota bacterium]|nr:diguanylate cyclase [Bacillota bacterium]
MAERVRERVSDMNEVPEPRITLSLGLAAYVPGEGKHIVLQRADNLLYAAKNSGRNKVMREDAASDD